MMEKSEMLKYPRTKHVEGSRLQLGDEDRTQVTWESLGENYLVIEEKIDGANSALSFSSEGELKLQSRGHYLTGGSREKHFALFKNWGSFHRGTLWEILVDRYIMFGEWMYAKHTVFYDRLPHYFMEFDIFDKKEQVFLATPRRHEMLSDAPVVSVPVLAREFGKQLPAPSTLVRRSLYKSDGWRKRLREQARVLGLDEDRVLRETDDSDDAEGLYIKVEHDGLVTDRLKWVRRTFLDSVIESESHWLNRPIVPNLLAPEVDIYCGQR